MRFRIHTPFELFLLLAFAAFSNLPTAAQGPITQQPAASPLPFRGEIAIDYSYLRSNAPPAGCGCFNLNGGDSTFAWTMKPGTFALVGDVAVAHAGSIASSSDSLTLSTFTAGGRYLPQLGHLSLQPFGQILVGLAHASGTLVQGSNPGASNAGATFAAKFGGGLDLRATRRFSIRLFEADYLLTNFDNGTNNHQNNINISAGMVVHFGTSWPLPRAAAARTSSEFSH